MRYLFYSYESSGTEPGAPALPDPYTATLWRPATTRLVPAGMSLSPGLVWWTMHHLSGFKNRDYSWLVIRDATGLVHRSGIFPGFFRFPFMARDDLQIGDVWTDPAHRGRGLATSAIQQVVAAHAQPGRRFWYLVEESNAPSIRAVEKAGFVCLGEGSKVSRWGLRALGAYVLQS